jgi:dynein heavy chain
MDYLFTFFAEYTIPTGQDVNAFRNAIEKLPLNDTPELFGLHSNADITYRTKQSQQILSTILGIFQ